MWSFAKKNPDFDWILDDESYFTLGHSSMHGNNSFYSSNLEQTPPSVKYSPRTKYEEKLLVWIAISSKGISEPYFVPSGLAINQTIYLKECIMKRLIPFIKKNHSDGKYVFWPDLASAHYAKSVTNYLEQKNIRFVPKIENPPNAPELRPIEDYWGILKGKVYDNGYKAKSLTALRAKIRLCMKNMSPDLVRKLGASTRGRLDRVRRTGLVEDH
jgi:transposase